MDIKLFENGLEFYNTNKDRLNNIDYSNLIKINKFSNETFIIMYDSLIVYSVYPILTIIGKTKDYDKVVSDLFIRNIKFKYVSIKENGIDFVSSFKKLFNYSFTLMDNNFYIAKENNIKRLVLSGGCFWCMAHPYYTFEGVIDVISGYSGGTSLNPTYLQVKHGNEYRESILIIFDIKKISYKKLLELYFTSINPFEDDGQFIDKGFSYTTCVYYKNKTILNTFLSLKIDIETRYKMEVKVKAEKENIFYPAEENHQKFEFKNKKEFLHEEEISGRNNYNFINFSKK